MGRFFSDREKSIQVRENMNKAVMSRMCKLSSWVAQEVSFTRDWDIHSGGARGGAWR